MDAILEEERPNEMARSLDRLQKNLFGKREDHKNVGMLCLLAVHLIWVEVYSTIINNVAAQVRTE